MIRAESLSRQYGDLIAVDEVTFDVSRGEIVGLLGPNGAGKTTIMKMLTGCHHPDGGRAFLNRIDISADPKSAKASFGYLPENAPLYDDLTSREFLEFVGSARGLRGAGLDDAIDRVVNLCALAEVIERPIAELSKGFRQRVGLAQAMMHRPDILILDEPTSGLDPNQIQEIRRVIAEFGRSGAVLFSTHILQEVEAVCDRVLILNKGRIVAAGTTSEIARGLRGGVIFMLRYRGSPPDSAATRALRDRVTILEQGRDGEEQWLRVSAKEVQEGGWLFQWAVSHGLVLDALIPERESLESVFAALTGDTSSDRQAETP